MLGLGNKLTKNQYNGFLGILDEIGNAKNVVFIFSPYKRLISKFNGDLVKVQRTSDYTSKWFGYDSNGDLKTDELLTWVGAGNDGLVEEVTNQVDNNYNSIQTNLSYKPKIITSGVLESNGLLFDGTDDYLNISNHDTINLLVPKLSLFIKAYNPTARTGYYFAKNNVSSSDVQYGLLNVLNNNQFKLEATNLSANYQTATIENFIGVWNDKDTDGVTFKNNLNEITGTRTTDLLMRPNVNIGCRSNSTDNSVRSAFFGGNIKTLIIFNSNELSNYTKLSNGV